VNRPLDYDVVVLHLQPDDLPDWQVRERGRPVVAMTVWEFDRLPPHWPHILNSTRGVIVPCRWNRDVFQAAGLRVPVAVVPHVAPTEAPGALPPLATLRPDDFVFSTIAAWRERNAPHLTLEAFLREFRDDDPVALILKTSRVNERRPFRGFWNHRVRRHVDTTARQIAAVRRRCRSTARVSVILDDLSDAGIAAIHARADAYVSLTRGEGFGLGAYEAAWAGNPVIITGHGGQLDFLPPEAALFVEHSMVPCSDRFAGPSAAVNLIGSSWAEPDLAEAGRLMRGLAADPAAARRRGTRLREHVACRFDPERITEGLVSFLEEACAP
jgi:glycosyltransferase involved in cell wall biosynthesis